MMVGRTKARSFLQSNKRGVIGDDEPFPQDICEVRVPRFQLFPADLWTRYTVSSFRQSWVPSGYLVGVIYCGCVFSFFLARLARGDWLALGALCAFGRRVGAQVSGADVHG